MTLTELRDKEALRHDLDTVYGPDWSISWTFAGHLEIMPGTPRDWADTTQAERVAWRDRLAELWQRKGWMAA